MSEESSHSPYLAPESHIEVASVSAEPMTAWKILFSFKGRIPRSTFWKYNFILIACYFVFLIGFGIISNIVFDKMEASSINITDDQETIFIAIGLFSMLFAIFIFYIIICIQAKRWHDLDYSAWMTLITFIPYVGWIFPLISCGFYKGTEGENRFGPNPLDYDDIYYI